MLSAPVPGLFLQDLLFLPPATGMHSPVLPFLFNLFGIVTLLVLRPVDVRLKVKFAILLEALRRSPFGISVNVCNGVIGDISSGSAGLLCVGINLTLT